MVASGNLGLRAIVCICAAGLLLVPGAAPASGATSIGQLDPGTPTGSCVGVSGWVQSTDAGAPSYVVPAGPWVIVSWSHRANAAAGRELAVRVWRATATTGSYTLVGTAALRTLTPGGINTFYERIPVSGGDLLGLRVGNPPATPLPTDFGGGASCAFSAGAGVGDVIRLGIAASEPPAGSAISLPTPFTPQRLNVTARLEPDADADGFGDETQDACAGTAGSSSGCAPASSPVPGKDTTKPSAKLSRRTDSIRDGRVTFWITASEAVSIRARGTLRTGSRAAMHRLRAVKANIAANSRSRVTLRLAKKTRRSALRALRRGKSLRARVSISLRDAAGNSSSANHVVRLKR